jgi:hypothetical protein
VMRASTARKRCRRCAPASNPVYKVWLELIQSCEYFGLKYQIIIIDENLGHINDSSSKKPELLISYKSNQIYPI